jgi:hypothetical protein
MTVNPLFASANCPADGMKTNINPFVSRRVSIIGAYGCVSKIMVQPAVCLSGGAGD